MQSIRHSLAAKVFLWVFCALGLCSLLVYGMVMAAIPRQYAVLTNSQATRAFQTLTDEISGMEPDTAGKAIHAYCARYRAAALLTTGDTSVSYGGDMGSGDLQSTLSLCANVQLADHEESSVLTAIVAASETGEITLAFVRILPAALALILLASALSAWVCSRLLAAPVLKISGVSKRMAQMDMTWRCEVNRSDELGVLADSLNTLSERLSQAMSQLESANAQLRREISATQALEKQRRDFFAAASHELKTPLTILQGQLESMALGIGDYKHHEKYLPQALETVESMETLVREILTISRMEAGLARESFTQEYLAPLLRDAVAEFAPLAQEKQIFLAADHLCEQTQASINPPLFRKAISNLLSNAVRYTPPGERIEVTLTGDALTITNTGATISPEELPTLFAPFTRVDKSRNRTSGGSGLGLYIVKTVLDLHGFKYTIGNVTNAVSFTIHLHQNEI